MNPFQPNQVIPLSSNNNTNKHSTTIARRRPRLCRLTPDAFLWITFGFFLHMVFTTLLTSHTENPLMGIQHHSLSSWQQVFFEKAIKVELDPIDNDPNFQSSLVAVQGQEYYNHDLDIETKDLAKQQLRVHIEEKTQSVEHYNHGDYFNMITTPRYHELPWSYKPKHIPPISTTFMNSTVVVRAPWFQSTKICKKTCCVENIAISLHQDDTRIKNTLDGKDLADVLMINEKQLPAHLKITDFHGTIFSVDILPCLKPGTILFLDNEPNILTLWFTKYRPLMNQNIPYLLITSDRDGKSPLPLYKDKLSKTNVDRLIMKWYGTNPDTRGVELPGKFVSFTLGLSKRVDQSYYMMQYLQQTNFTNPFAGTINKKRWIESQELQTATETTNIMFVNFRLNKFSMHRKVPFELGCHHLNYSIVQPISPISCSTGNYSIPEIYSAASKYLFGLSPIGNGWDCFRTYELWLLGVIPIVQKKSPAMTQMYHGLPFIEVQNWSNHTQQSLLQLMRNYIQSEEFQKNDFSGWERLFLRYWRRKILTDAGRMKDIIKDEQGREYYQGWKYTLHNSSVAN